MIARLKVVLAQSDKLKEYMRGYHEEFTEAARHHRNEAIRIDKRLAHLQAGIMRQLDLLENDFTIPVNDIGMKIDKMEKERVVLAEQKRLLGTDTNVVEFHPGSVQYYAKAIDELNDRLSGGDELTAEARAIFRALVGAVKVNPVPSRAPNDLELFANVPALMGTPMLKAARAVSEIVAENGGSARYAVGNEGKPGLPLSNNQVVSLGRWRAAA